MYNVGNILSGTQGGLFGLGGFFGPGFNIANSLYEGQAPVMQALVSAQAQRGRGPYGGQQGGGSVKPADSKNFMPLDQMRQLQEKATQMMMRPDDTPSLYRFNQLFERPTPTTPVGVLKTPNEEN
jgi:hypothetical protein